MKESTARPAVDTRVRPHNSDAAEITRTLLEAMGPALDAGDLRSLSPRDVRLWAQGRRAALVACDMQPQGGAR